MRPLVYLDGHNPEITHIRPKVETSSFIEKLLDVFLADALALHLLT
jgi:hypothetical protein